MMTREEAIKTFEDILQLSPTLDETGCSVTEAMKVALSALRPVSREQVEKGEWQHIPLNMSPQYFAYKYNLRKKCSLCKYAMPDEYPNFNFCPACGAPMTDEAVQMVMERLEALYENRD